MKNKVMLLMLVVSLCQILSAVAQVIDTVPKDTSQNTKGSTIISPGNVNTGTSTNTGVLSADTSVSVFILQAAAGGEKEIRLGKLAQSKALHRSVKSFASKMVSDHTKANKELQKIANKKKITIPESFADERHSEMLENKSGADFDKAYLEMMVSDHKVTVGLFEKATAGLADQELKAFAEKTLPTLRHHYDVAKALSKKFNANTSGNP